MQASTALLGWVETIDQYGKAGWIGLMVLGFVLFWPVGLAILGYLLWSGRMGSCGHHKRHWKSRSRSDYRATFTSSGNTAFDEYREETLRRLEEEKTEFTTFLDRLRKAKDKAEFDDFMDERRRAPRDVTPDDEAPATP